jgi:hypothetical protein
MRVKFGRKKTKRRWNCRKKNNLTNDPK